ncbi:response regulator [bacterium]|nr:response regulator [bacterium]
MTKARIQIVEDEAIIYEGLKLSLEHIGYEVVASAQTGQEAIEKAEEHQPDIILMDIKLKGEMDGIEAAAIIRSRASIPIIYLTAFAEEKRFERAKLTSPYAYMLKPVKNKDLHIAIEIALHSSKADAKRRTAEDALIRSEKRFRQLVENLTIGILIIQNKQIVYQNPECRKMIGKLSDLHIENFYKNIYTGDRQLVEDSFEKVISGEFQTTIPQFRLLYSPVDGNDIVEKWMQSMASKIKYQDEDAILVNLLDVTKTREMENHINIQDKMSSLGRISAGIAHEIRNPLSGINAYLYSLQKFVDQENFDPEQVQLAKHIVGQIKTASQKIESVIKRVIDFSKMSTLNIVSMDANTAVNEAIELSSTSLRKAGIKLRLSFAESPLQCFADPQLLEQVVLNLIDNAAKAVEMTNTDKIIEVSTGLIGNNIAITVSDSGIGIKPEIRHKIFEPFFSTRKDGSGIGLAIARRIISDHGGTISVYKGSLGGAAFRIELPTNKSKVTEQ